MISENMPDEVYNNYIDSLNDNGVPEHDHPDNGGRVPRHMLSNYGGWLEENDPTAFSVGLSEYEREYQDAMNHRDEF